MLRLATINCAKISVDCVWVQVARRVELWLSGQPASTKWTPSLCRRQQSRRDTYRAPQSELPAQLPIDRRVSCGGESTVARCKARHVWWPDLRLECRVASIDGPESLTAAAFLDFPLWFGTSVKVLRRLRQSTSNPSPTRHCTSSARLASTRLDCTYFDSGLRAAKPVAYTSVAVGVHGKECRQRCSREESRKGVGSDNTGLGSEQCWSLWHSSIQCMYMCWRTHFLAYLFGCHFYWYVCGFSGDVMCLKKTSLKKSPTTRYNEVIAYVRCITNRTYVRILCTYSGCT